MSTMPPGQNPDHTAPSAEAPRSRAMQIIVTILRGIEIPSAFVVSALLVALLIAVWRPLTQPRITITPLSVPKALELRGYTPEVAAGRLQDAINAIVLEAHSSLQGPEFTARSPQVGVREVWFAPDAIASWIGAKLGFRKRWDISGEIVFVHTSTDKAA